MDPRIAFGVSAIATFAVGKIIKDKIAERKLRQEITEILIQEEMREELEAIAAAEQIVKSRIREGRYHTAQEVTTDLQFETIIHRYN